MNLYADLFLTFARIGGLTFGGGYAMLPILEKEVVENRGWCKEEELTDYYAIGQCTPGVIAVNTATFVGSKLAGIPGGIVATLGVVFPSMVIITVIAAFLRNFADNPYVIHAFAGLRVVVTVLVLNTVIKLLKSNVKGKGLPTLILFALVLIASFFFKISSVLLVVIAMVWGLFFGLWFRKEEKK
ncbi:MAG: chromate transporter [Lachnospiraceae bacterium]|jgi:chromate transporter|nr:chromate transporter [Lachnospiraceae bacterium]